WAFGRSRSITALQERVETPTERVNNRHSKNWVAHLIARPGAFQRPRKSRVKVGARRITMNIDGASVVPTHSNIVELERLGDEIAELAAHLDAATARCSISSASSTPAAAGAMAVGRAPTGSPGASGSSWAPRASTSAWRARWVRCRG